MEAAPFRTALGALGVVCLLRVPGRKSSDNENGSTATVNPSSPRFVAVSACAVLPSATDLAKLLERLPIPARPADYFTERPSAALSSTETDRYGS
jgi:hypothetical protein